MTALIDRTAAIAAAVKPRRYGSWYVAEHRIRGIRSYYKTLLFTAIGSPFMYLFALGVGLATLVDKNSGLGGTSYLAFVAPALIASAAVTAAVEECTYPILMGFKWNPIFFGMNAAPISGNQIVNGIFIAVLARLLPTTLVYYVVMLIFGAVPSPLGVLDIPIAILTGMAFGLVIASYMSTVQQDVGQPAFIQRFIVIPLFLFSGTFFPLSQMPVFLQWIGWISPLWHGTELGRVVSYGAVEPGWLTLVHVLYPLALCIYGWRRTQVVVTRRLNK
jgi:lipooligosaccharide transport system permease protein